MSTRLSFPRSITYFSHEYAPKLLVDSEVVKISALLSKPNRIEAPSLVDEFFTESDVVVTKPGDVSVHYDCELPDIKGKFDEYKAKALGLKPGPTYRELLKMSPLLFRSAVKKIQEIHAQLIANGIQDGILATRLLGFYLLSNSFYDAQKLFCELQLCYAAPWNWMIRGLTMMGHYQTAVLFYFKMLALDTHPDKYTYPYVIKACGFLQDVELLKYIHGMIKYFKFEHDVYVGSALVKFYSDNGCLYNVRDVFDRLPQRDIVLWNAMLDAYSRSEGLEYHVLGLFQEMRGGKVQPNPITFTCILSFCGSKSLVSLGTQVHCLVLRFGLDMDYVVANTLVSMYAKCHYIFYARKIFDFSTQDDVITWNAMIGGYVQNGLMKDALCFFQKMISANAKPDRTTFSSLLSSVVELGCLNQGKEIHSFIIRHGIILDLHLKNALIDMYFKFKNTDMAYKVFNLSSDVDVVIFSAMISGFVLNGMNAEAVSFFRRMLDMKMKPNAITLASALPACAGLATLNLGKELHGCIIRKGYEQTCYVGSALCDMYGKCGQLDLCYRVFLRITERDSICWNSVITNLCRSGKPEEAMHLFRSMALENAMYDCVTISAALSACGSLCNLHHGKEIHAFMVRGGHHFDIFCNSALIDMYAKCGSLNFAHRVFVVMQYKNEVSWNSIISAYGNYGHLNQSLDLLHDMQNKGFQPDQVTFLSVISACGHAGQVEIGKKYFHAMLQDHKINPRMEHYACLIDLLGRAGHLDEAFHITETMPFPPDAGIWGTILGACRMHGAIELAQIASAHLRKLDPQNSGYYILLSNMHANSGTWSRVDEIRDMMKERGVQKIRGESWIEVNKTAHVFGAADMSHPEYFHLYEVINSLLLELHDEASAESDAFAFFGFN